MDLHDLKHFRLLSETLHFGKAGVLGALSPSALSRCISRMEGELGCRLFERDNKSVRITREGEEFLRFAEETLKGFSEIRDSFLQEKDELRGEITVYSSVTACFSILPDLIRRFRAGKPGVHILLKTGDESLASEKVLEGEADIAVLAKPEALPRGLAFREITRTPLVFIAPAIPCAVRDLVFGRADPWGGVPFILSEHGLARKRADEWFRKKGIRPAVYAQVSGNEAILAMVSLGCGVGVVPGLVLEKSPVRHEVEVIPAEPKLSGYIVGIAALKRRLGSPVIRAFWECGLEN